MGILGCLGASDDSSSPRSLISNEQNVAEIFRRDYNVDTDAVLITPQTVKAMFPLNLMDKPKVISCCLMLYKLSSHDDIDIEAEFDNITGYHVRAEDSCTVIAFQYHNLSVECYCPHLNDFKEMLRSLIGNVPNVNQKVESLKDVFLTSLSTCKSHLTSGGKSQSTFMQSEDGVFLAKEIKEKEYDSFKSFGNQLLDHIARGQTCLNLPWGVYKLITIDDKSFHLVTDKLRILGASDLVLFDLKGIQGRRAPNETSTGLDEDFVDEMLRSGFSLSRDETNTLLECVQRDAQFLQMINVMDYSLLIGWDKMGGKVVYNIIDYLVPFNKMKKLEYASNSLRWMLHLRSLPPTVIPPAAYASRLMKFVMRTINRNVGQ